MPPNNNPFERLDAEMLAIITIIFGGLRMLVLEISRQGAQRTAWEILKAVGGRFVPGLGVLGGAYAIYRLIRWMYQNQAALQQPIMMPASVQARVNIPLLQLTPADVLRTDYQQQYVAQPLPDYYQCPVLLFKTFVTQIDFGVRAGTPLAMELTAWKEYVLCLRTDQDRLIQYAIVYKELVRLLEIAERDYNLRGKEVTELVGGQEFPDFYNMLDILLRDFVGIQQQNLASGESLHELHQHALPWIDSVNMPPNAPLKCLPANQFTEGDHRITQTLRLLQCVEIDDDTGLLSKAEFKAVIHKTSCRNCIKQTTPFTEPAQASLINNPVVRDRALFNLMHKLTNTDRLVKPSAICETQITALKLFDRDSPFVYMQRMVLYLQDELKKLSSWDATLIGDFKPITDPTDFPIPLFKRADGNILGFFWHGTNEQNSANISDTSFLNSRFQRGLYGAGTYFAIQACKSLQYTGYNDKHCLLLCAVFLGKKLHYTNSNGAYPANATVNIAVPGYANRSRQNHWEFIVPTEAQAVPLLKVTMFGSQYRSAQPVKLPPLDICPVM